MVYDIKGKILLAPMEDITNISYRILARKYGANLTFTEMVPANFLVRFPKKEDYMRSKVYEKLITNDEDCSFVQIFGDNADVISKAAKILEETAFKGIDINMGCPAPKIVKNGSGSFLLSKPELVEEILSKTRKSIKKPLSVKIRLGYDKVNYKEIIRIAEKYVDFITIHGRLQTQGYSGIADWEAIREAKRCSKVPIVGNGDICSIEQAKELMANGYCDAVMIGRASYKNIKLFSGISVLNKEESKLLVLEYYKLWKKYSPNDIYKLRFFTQWTYKSDNIKDLRRKINILKDEKKIISLM